MATDDLLDPEQQDLDSAYLNFRSSVPENDRVLVDTFQFAQEVQDFIGKNPVGRYLIEATAEAKNDAMASALGSPDDTPEHRDAMMRARAHNYMLGWLNEAIVAGLEAERQLRSEDMERHNDG